MKMENFLGTSEKKLREYFTQWNVKPYHLHQVFTWVYHKEVRDFALMTNLSKSLRQQLSETFYFSLPGLLEKFPSQDGTVKYLFELEDGSTIESVWMPSEDRKTLCISTQVGCRLACTFCQTGTLGLKRNLSAGEIIGQIIKVNGELAEKDRITNIVVMGMGEPLDNYQPLVDALRLMVAPEAMKISTRKITLSTSGLVDKIKNFQEENIHVNLAISLNATLDETRDQIMPINKKYPLDVLLDTLRNYPLKPNRKLTFEYVLLAGINDTDDDAVRLARLLRGIPSKINLIPFNRIEPSDYHPPSESRLQAFQNYLISKNYSVFIRKNRGTDIMGACGQLAAQPSF